MARAPYRRLVFSMGHTYAGISVYVLRDGGWSAHGDAMSYPGIRFRTLSQDELFDRCWAFMEEYAINYRYDLGHSPAAPMSREWFEDQIRKDNSNVQG